MIIKDFLDKYRMRLDSLDLELIIAHVINKSREFVLSHPEYELVKNEELKIRTCLSRRLAHEPLAFLLGEKEFYGLKFKVNKNTLIPRPETEMLVEETLKLAKGKNNLIIDIGTGSGNIIIAIAKQFKNSKLIGIDTSQKALEVAKQNAKINKVNKKIKFIKGDLLDPIIQNSKFKIQNSTMIIVANLPYLSKEIYDSAPKDVKNFEPKSALFSFKKGLAHYEKLLRQIKKTKLNYDKKINIILEFSPEQKILLSNLIKKIFPELSKIEFKKDLSGKWRICKIEI